MIVVMEKNASEEQLQHMIDRVQHLGLKAHVIRGVERTVIAAVGDER
ncbi:MAG: 3-deoxy-7-phosphoheptulonate synthase, partial [Planctomycetales bacterium]|nr:3-deoxy-7-phosphoheptulonate synthase [Planctomycetales bacterium]